MLIKLTAIINPDVDGGTPAPCYVDATRILWIGRSQVQFTKRDSIEEKKRLHDKLYAAAVALWKHVGEYIPSMTDPVAVEWMSRARESASIVTQAHELWARSWKVEDQHPAQSCTEIQLACGTALEHGVMLARVWVSETPEEVAALVRQRSGA
jgi:hypothetical protein